MIKGDRTTVGSAASADSFESLVADVAGALDAAPLAWRARLAAAAAEWRGRGVEVRVLERAVALQAAPEVDTLLATFDRAARQLAAYESEAVALDPALVGAAVFRDPERVRDAAGLVQQLRRAHASATPDCYPDAELWVLEWPDVGDFLVGELA